MMTATCLLDTGASRNLVNKSFLSQKWQEYVKPVMQPQFRTANYKHVNVEGIVPMFVHIGDQSFLAGSE